MPRRGRGTADVLRVPHVDLSLPASQGLLKGVNRDVAVCYAAARGLSRPSGHESRALSHRTSPTRKIPTPTISGTQYRGTWRTWTSTMQRPTNATISPAIMSLPPELRLAMFDPHFSATRMRRPVEPARYGRPS